MPFKVTKQGVTLNIRLAPKARENRILGLADIEDGQKAFKISVNAIPEDGKANKALIDFIAKTISIPKTSISLISGHKNKTKVLLISGEADDIIQKISKNLPLTT